MKNKYNEDKYEGKYRVLVMLQMPSKGYEVEHDLYGTFYYLDGNLHKEDGPAAGLFFYLHGVVYKEDKFWTVQKKCFKCKIEFNNFYDLKVHLEQYNDGKDMVEYIYELLLQ